MTELLTAAQMRAIEDAAIASGGVTGLELMERAGQGVVDAVFAEWPELARSAPAASGAGGAAPSSLRSSPPEYFDQSEGLGHRAVILCGPGNNGGDGFVVARLLKEAGWDVDVFFYGEAAKLPSDARANYERWLEMGEVQPAAHAALPVCDLIIDAFFGTGLSRGFVAPEGLNWGFHELMADGFWWNGAVSKPYVVAVDVISEVDANSGRVLRADAEWGGEMGAHLTVSFHRPRIGHYLNEGPTISGKLSIVDIGLPQEIDPNAYNPALRDRSLVRLVSRPEFDYFEANLTKKINFPHPTGPHKYTHGHALILSGSVGKGGAARLAARGALRIGAGAVTLGVPPAALIENAAQLNTVMLESVKGVGKLAAILADTRINALCVGPGFGKAEREKALLAAVLTASGPGRGVVLDADALTILAQEPPLFAALHDNCVLTPHAGEFARLFPDIAAKLAAPAIKGPAYSKVDATREAARRAGCVVLFKGPDTVIAAPDGQCSINASVYDRAAPWLATAGSGDVLAGFITGLLARGYAPMQAAETGAWLHTECALSFGPGLIAEDIPEELPKILTALLSEQA